MTNKAKKNYAAWDIDEKDFPANGSLEDKIRFLVGYGILAPSTHNTQPWLFEIIGNRLLIKPNNQLKLSVGDPDSHGLYISLGACAENIKQAANNFGLEAELSFGDSAVEITFNPKNKKVNSKVFANIKNRHSHKLPYDSKPLPKTVADDLAKLSNDLVSVHIVKPGELFDKLVDLHMESAEAMAKDRKFTLELVNWLRTNNTKAYDGMPGFVVGNSQLKSLIGKKLLKKKPEILGKMAGADRKLMESSSALAVFTIGQNQLSAESFMESGQIIEKAWLKLTEYGLVAHPLFASIQYSPVAKKLKAALGGSGSPVFLMRIGYSDSRKFHSPRFNTTMLGAKPSNQETRDRITNKLKSRPQEHQITVGKYKINYITAGQGQPVLMLHGANIGWPQWHKNLDELAEKFKIYAVDLPGAGGSTKVNFHKTNFEKDYVDVVDKFITKLGLSKIDVIGSSFGGWVAMRLAIENKPYINRLVVVNPIGFTKYMPPKFRPVSIYPLALLMSKSALKPKRSNKNLEKFMRDVFYQKDIPLMPEFIDYFYSLSEESHNLLFISRLAHYSGMRKELFLGASLPKIKVPTLVIWGKKDPLMPYRTVKDNFSKIPNVKIKTLENTGHMPPVESAELFDKHVIDFLKGN